MMQTLSFFRWLPKLAAIVLLLAPTTLVAGQALSSPEACPAEALAACPPAMTSLWPLDEPSGNVFVDVQSSHHATCNAAECPASITGLLDRSRSFRGFTDDPYAPLSTKVNVVADPDFDWGPHDSFSIELWMRKPAGSTCTDVNHSTQVFVGRNDPALNSLHWWLGCEGLGTATLVVRDLGGTEAAVTSTVDITDGVWHHIVGMHDAGPASSVLRLYVDGQPQGATSVTYTMGFASDSVPLNLGWLDARPSVVDYFYAGALDEIAIYGRALSEAEILQHMELNQAGFDTCTEPTPTATATSTATATPTATATASATATATWTSTATLTATAPTATATSTATASATATRTPTATPTATQWSPVNWVYLPAVLW
jgi:hypothetical protein